MVLPRKAAYYGDKPQDIVILSGTAALDFPSIPAATSAELTITVTGAVVGNAVALIAPATLTTGLVWAGRVTAANTVTVRLANVTASAIDPASATWGAVVIQP